MTLDLSGIDTKAAFHMLMKRELEFPDWYGVGWNAIIAVVEMPDCVVLRD